MNYKSILYKLIISVIFLDFASLGARAMEPDDFLRTSSTLSLKPTENQPNNSIERDITTLKNILQKHDDDPFVSDHDYKKLGDPLVEFAKKNEHLSHRENFSRVIELYEKDKLKGLLNLPRITWLAVQLSMTLTQEENPKKKAVTTPSNLMKHLQKAPNNTPLWLMDVEELENYEKNTGNYFFKTLKTCHSLFLPLSVYKDSGNFSLRDYFKAMSSGVFLFGLDPLQGKGHTVHGGIFKSGAEKTLHDIIHYYQQWVKDYRTLDEIESSIEKYKKYAGLWRKMAETIHSVLETENNLSPQEKSQLEIFSFLMMHEGVFAIPSVLKTFEGETVVDIVRIIGAALKEDLFPKLSKPNNKDKFYEVIATKDIEVRNPNYELHSILEVKEDEVEAYKTIITYIAKEKGKNSKIAKKIQLWVNGLDNYEHWKTFYRDLGHMLIERNLWTPKNKKLGTNYEMEKVKNVIEQIYKWFMRTTDKNGKLYDHFSKAAY